MVNGHHKFKKKKKITNPDLQHHLSKRMWPFTNDDNDYGPFFEGKLMISQSFHSTALNSLYKEA